MNTKNRQKSRYVCNIVPSRRGSVIIIDTYTSSLEQTGSRILWAIAAINNHIMMGANTIFLQNHHHPNPHYTCTLIHKFKSGGSKNEIYHYHLHNVSCVLKNPTQTHINFIPVGNHFIHHNIRIMI